MKRQKFENICHSIASGQKEFVENRQLLYTGKVIGCHNNRFEIEIFGHRTEWPMYQCEPSSGRRNPLGPPSNV